MLQSTPATALSGHPVVMLSASETTPPLIATWLHFRNPDSATCCQSSVFFHDPFSHRVSTVTEAAPLQMAAPGPSARTLNLPHSVEPQLFFMMPLCLQKQHDVGDS